MHKTIKISNVKGFCPSCKSAIKKAIIVNYAGKSFQADISLCEHCGEILGINLFTFHDSNFGKNQSSNKKIGDKK